MFSKKMENQEVASEESLVKQRMFDLYPLLWRLSENKEKENKENKETRYEFYPSLWKKSKNKESI
jgi:hypothetical protein